MSDFSQVVSAPTGRFSTIERPYAVEDVLRLRGSFPVEHTLARRGALRLWELLQADEPVRALGAVTGNQAMQMVRAGLQAIYLSGWQAAADANTAGAMYPDQSLYPANTGPELARRINRTLARADQVEHLEGGAKLDWFAPILADAEAGFGGPLNCFEIMKSYI
jgi:isocitrate lyase